MFFLLACLSFISYSTVLHLQLRGMLTFRALFILFFFFNSFTSSVMSCMRITTYKLCMKNACCHNKIIQRCLKENFWLASVRVSSDTSAESLNVFSEGNCLQCMMWYDFFGTGRYRVARGFAFESRSHNRREFAN